ncbi:oligosaccharyl transferase, archaeosortase A system-associated [uncultured Methanomethylovorans sp.]|uniref:oligosaccharyl transferase, archaeosortase A system-associated n=1 Tax=uncultured Methanomethylovorans sp. TaxID=183759 RepID=UPI002AA7CB1E|nr:oligosaccharyl transferase, archaeosortase A system-associated [uncultured Methanomethylovorans sp.]
MNKINSLSIRTKIMLVMLFALLIRLFPLSFLFSDGRVTFVSYDSYYHMRSILYTTQHFPHYLLSDSYINFPLGFDISWPPLYDILASMVALIIGLGNPSVSTIELVAALFPVVLGTLSLIPLYFAASKLFGQRVGFYSIVVLAIMPIHILVSMFGATDHHVAEILISTSAFALFIYSLKDNVYFDDFKKITKTELITSIFSRSALYSISAGFLLAVSVLTWTGSPIFIGLFAFYIPIQLAIDLRAKKNSVYLLVNSCLMYLTALVIVTPLVLFMARQGYELSAAFVSWFHVLYILLMLVFTLICWIVAYLLNSKGQWWYYPLIILVLIAVAFISVKSLMPTFFSNIMAGVSYLLGFDETLSTINEALPLFWDQYGSFTLKSVWGGFGLFFLLAVISLIFVIRKGEPSKYPAISFLVVWSVVVFVLAFSQRRFMYLLCINVSVLSGYFMGELHSWLMPKVVKEHAGKHKKSSQSNPSKTSLLMVIGMLLLPGFLISAAAVSSPSVMPSDWEDTLDWLKVNTPVTSYYTDPVQTPEYGVLSWWDFGNWIIYRSQRPVVTNNFQPSVQDAAAFFLSQNETKASNILDERNVKYILTDISMVKGKFFNIAKLAGEDYNSFFDNETTNKGSSTVTTKVENDKFKNTMLVKLHVYDGSASGHYRLLYESNTTVTKDPDVKYVKVFEYVKGVKVTGKAEPGETVYGATTLISNEGRKFDYYNSAVAGEDGTYNLVLAYSTENSDLSTHAILPYTIIGKKSLSSKQINVTDSAVQTGEVLLLDLV